MHSPLGAYLSVWWFDHQLFCSSRTANSSAPTARLRSIRPRSCGTASSPHSDSIAPSNHRSSIRKASISSEESPDRITLDPFSGQTASNSLLSCILIVALICDHKPSALSAAHPRRPATLFDPNRFNFLLNFTAAFVHMLDVALKLFILTGASTFMGKTHPSTGELLSFCLFV